jgi:DNA polymerase-3 subunit delta
MSDDLADLKLVYLIYGTQEMKLEQALERLKSRFGQAGDLDFNLQVFRGESARADEVVAACNTMPFMSERRLVIVKDADKLPKADLDVLASYAKSPSATTTLVLVAEKIDRRTSLYSAIDAGGGVAEYRAPKKSEYPTEVIQLFSAKGRTVGRDAAEALVTAVGHDLTRLSLEVDKVVAYAGDQRTLSRSDLEEVMSSTAATSVFEFVDALGSRDARAALQCVAELVSQGESVHGIHAMGVRRVRDLIAVQTLISRGLTASSAIAGALKRQEWQVRDYPRQARRFEAGELVSALRLAAAAEAEMKTSRDSRLVLERWVLAVCGA